MDTLRVGLGVLSIRTAHCIRVVGGLAVGTTGSSSRVSDVSIGVKDKETVGDGGGSANSSIISE